jgi:hypothetical protein
VTTVRTRDYRFRIVVVHGEGRSLFHVTDTEALPDEQPCVLATYHSRTEAEEALATLFNPKGENPP